MIGLAAALLTGIHWGFRAPVVRETSDPKAYGLPYSPVWIPSLTGKRLFAWYLPTDEACATVVMMHGWGGNAEMMLPLAKVFHGAGMNVLLFDARNHGQSARQGHSSLPRFAQDLDAAITWLRQQAWHTPGPLVLLGHSLGGAAVLLAASRRRDIAAVISIAAFAHPRWVMQRTLRHPLIPKGLVTLISNYVQWVIGQRFDSIAPVHTVCRIQCPVLLVHGQQDTTVPIEDAHAILAACPRTQIELLEVPHAGHASVEMIEAHAAQLYAFLRKWGIAAR